MEMNTETTYTNMDKRRIRNDYLLIAVVLAIAAALFFVVIFIRRAGGRVVVRVNGEVSATYPLTEDRAVTIEGEGGTNLLVIEDGKACVSDADCPDKLCVNQGKIRYSGQSIVCLPHRLTVVIEDGAEDDIDSVAK